MPNLNQQDRADFEAWAAADLAEDIDLDDDPFKRGEDGQYLHALVRNSFAPWKAAMELAARRQHGSAAPAQSLVEAGALRQYHHNDGSEGFVFGYDCTITDRFIASLGHGSAAQAVYLVQHKQASGKECRDWTEVPAASFDVYSGDGFNTRILYAAPPVADAEGVTFDRRWSLARDGFGLQRDDVSGNYVALDDAVAVLHAALSRRPAAAPEDAQQQDSGSCDAALHAAPAATDQVSSAVLVCSKCGADRMKEPCGSLSDCVLVGIAQSMSLPAEQSLMAGAAKGGMTVQHATDEIMYHVANEPNREKVRAIVENTVETIARAHLSAQGSKDSERLDFVAYHGISLRKDPVNGRSFMVAAYHTGIPCVDDHHRFDNPRAAIDAAKAKGEQA